MAQNITLLGASYSDVPAVALPKTGGGTAKFIDITDTTATASDVAQGKYFYTADGTKAEGTATGGGGGSDEWQRPAEFPDLSLLDRTGEVVYMSCMADEARGYFYINLKTSNSQPYNVAIGTITDGEYVVEREFTLAHNKEQRQYFGRPGGGYKVIRVTPPTGGHITTFSTSTAYENAYWATDVVSGEQVPALAEWQGVVEIYGNLPYMNGALSCRSNKLLRSFDVQHVAPSSLDYGFRYCQSLENVDMSTWDTSNTTTFNNCFANTGLVRYLPGINDLDLSNCTFLGMAFANVSIDEVDMSKWNLAKLTNMTSIFSGSRIKKIKAKNSDVACSYANAFSNCYYLQEIDISDLDLSMATSVDALFSNDMVLSSLDFASLDFSSLSTAASTQNVVQGTKSLRSLTVPASLTIIGNGAFSNMESCSEYHFLATTPPTLNNTNVFNNMNTRVTKKIYVPYSADHSVLTAYQSATNWSTYASYIEEEPQT